MLSFFVNLINKKSGNHIRYYAIRSIYLEGKRNTTEVVRKFGSHEELLQRDLGGLTPEAWCREEIRKMTEEASVGKVFLALDSQKRVPKDEPKGLYHKGTGIPRKTQANVSFAAQMDRRLKKPQAKKKVRKDYEKPHVGAQKRGHTRNGRQIGRASCRERV